MYEVSRPDAHPGPEVSPALRWERVKDALGVTTQEEVAEITGVPLRTLHRLFDNPATSEMRHAFQVRARTGIGIDELFNVGGMAEAA
ncbi:hypothetical protein [Micromonospora sp. NPDC049891]|uniref:hypothetical protein n=1 Tax=Micromonospora sp. NPDC049891 TaxID=3155655 RepID=UPI0033CF01CC